MGYRNILNDALNYPFKDFGQFVKLAIPSLIMAIIVTLTQSIFWHDMINGFDYSGYYHPEQTIHGISMATFGMMELLTIIITIIVAIINLGIIIAIIRNTTKESSILPEFKPVDFFIDGIKLLAVIVSYVIIPTVILITLIALSISINSHSLVVLSVIIYLILLFLILLVSPVAYGKLAETDSIAQAVSFRNIWNISKNIGIVNILAMLILLGLIYFIINLLSNLLAIIPFIGEIIKIGIIDFFLIMFMSRVYGLIYLEQYKNNPNYNPYNMTYPQQQYNNQMNNQQYYQPYHQQYHQQYYQQTHQDNSQYYQQYPQEEDSIYIKTKKTIKCPICGQQNPRNANKCIKCKNELQ